LSWAIFENGIATTIEHYSLLKKRPWKENRSYHLFDDQTIQEIKDLIIAIGNEYRADLVYSKRRC